MHAQSINSTASTMMPRRPSWSLLVSILLANALHSSFTFSWLPQKSFQSLKSLPTAQKRRLHQSLLFSTTLDDDWNDLLDNFAGDFDNYDQVVEDRLNGLLPREGGGHEQIHCTLIPISSSSRLAAFYFDGLPNKIFRFRYYKFEETCNKESIEMKLYTLHPKLEQELRATLDPTEWPRVVQEFRSCNKHEKMVQELPKCDIQWSRDMDPIQHNYTFPSSHEESFHAVMVYGQAVVNSTSMLPGQALLIKDQLSLGKDDFYIHDRGFDPDTGAYIYGNQRGIPYMLKRVTRINPDSGQRIVTNQNLQWTLGDKWRTQQEYDENTNALLVTTNNI